jgi:rfaE bifunctional protein kinase chain/domain
MTPGRFRALASNFGSLRIAVLGDFCLDRYLEIDPGLQEVSLETGLPVHNVINVRGQPGGAGTVVNNLSALGIGRIIPVGLCGEDSEGFELRRALSSVRGVAMEHFVTTPLRRTFTYTKPLLLRPGREPKELSRLDQKNWSQTPSALSERLCRSIQRLAAAVDAMIVLDQTDVAGTGVIGPAVLKALKRTTQVRPGLLVLADSRRGLADFPAVTYKMNLSELATHTGSRQRLSLSQARRLAGTVAAKTGRLVFITLARHGILAASPDGGLMHSLAVPVRGKIDIVGAGDAVTANLAASLATRAKVIESLEIANAAASVVIHKLGTTGTASVSEIVAFLGKR